MQHPRLTAGPLVHHVPTGDDVRPSIERAAGWDDLDLHASMVFRPVPHPGWPDCGPVERDGTGFGSRIQHTS